MKKNILKIVSLSFAIGMFPGLIFAAESAECQKAANMASLKDVLVYASCFLSNYVIPLLFTLAIVAFIWGVIQFYLNPDNEEKRKKGKTFIVGGLIALFVMTSIWGIIGIFTNTFKFEGKNTIKESQLPNIEMGGSK